MAVITCPHCRKYISSLLTVCPECGRPVSLSSNAEPSDESSSEAPTASCDAADTSGTPLDQPALSPEEPAQDPLPDASDAAKPRFSLRRWLGFSFLLAVVLGLLSFLYYTHQRNASLEQRAYERLSGCVDLDFYEDYIVRFPDGKHIDEVKDQLNKIKQERAIYLSSTKTGTREELRQFIKAHPDSPYRRVCELRVDSLDWSAASSANSVESYDHYLELHPDGIFAEAATESKNRQARLEVTKEEYSKINGMLNSFLTALSSNEAPRIDAVIGEPISFCGQNDSKGVEILTFFRQHFSQTDILGVHFSVVKDVVIKKYPSVSQSGQLDYEISAQLEATLNRTAIDSLNLQHWSLHAQLNPDRKFTNVDMSRLK